MKGNNKAEDETMKAEATTVARQIAREHNDRIGALSGGFFLADKTTGECGSWMSANSMPSYDRSVYVRIEIGWRPITAAEVTELIAEQEAASA